MNISIPKPRQNAEQSVQSVCPSHLQPPIENNFTKCITILPIATLIVAFLMFMVLVVGGLYSALKCNCSHSEQPGDWLHMLKSDVMKAMNCSEHQNDQRIAKSVIERFDMLFKVW